MLHDFQPGSVALTVMFADLRGATSPLTVMFDLLDGQNVQETRFRALAALIR